MEDTSEEEPTLDVAPLISDAKAAQALRRFLSTVFGGGRILPGMTFKIYFFQVLLWFCPVLLSATLAFAVDFTSEESSNFPYFRLILGVALNLAFGVSLEVLHGVFVRLGRRKRVSAEPGIAKMAWLDDEEVDFHYLCSSQVMDILLPRRPPVAALCRCVISSVLGGLTAQLLVPKNLAATLKLDPTSSMVVSCWVFLTAGTAHFGLHVQSTTEVSLSSTESRPFLVIALLLPLLFELPVEVARGLLVSVALLPLLWAIGVLPSMLDLLLWSSEQVELHFFGGSMLPMVLLSFSIAAGMTWAGRDKLLMDASLDQLLLAIISLSCTALLTCAAAFDLRLKHPRGCFFKCLGCWLQVAVAAGLLIPCILMLPNDVLIPLRLAMEQVALLLTLLAVYIFGVRQLSVSCCGLRNQQYLRQRKQLLWGDGGPREAPPGPVSAQLMEVTSTTTDSAGLGPSALQSLRLPFRARRHAQHVEVLEIIARIVVLVHMGLFGTPSLIAYRGEDFWQFVLVALQLRQMRIAFLDVPKAALDAALAGLLHLASWNFSTWPTAVQICFVSVLRQRGVVFCALLRYVVHLSRITRALPKLRHPLTSLLLWLNALLWPGLLVVLMFAAILETPLIAVFSLPLFTLAAPRWSRVAGTLSSTPLVKGAEGLFYSILAPSLLHGLAQQWRAGTLRRENGTLLFCRSHERLACVVRVLAHGYGWVQVELRGLELQEPTSCHHVEAGKIDEAFAHAFEGQRAPERPSFVLEPICEIVVDTYEQSVVSVRGLLDNPEVLRQIHVLFLKSLVWVMMSLKEIPEGWLTCPLKPQDTTEVLQQLCNMTWPAEVSQALYASSRTSNAEASASASASASALRDAAASPNSAVAPANIPRPPGTPPIIRPPQKASPEVVSPPLPTLESERHPVEAVPADVEDLDTLMDQVLGMAPSMGRMRSIQSRDAAPARQAARKLLVHNEGDDAWAAPVLRAPVANSALGHRLSHSSVGAPATGGTTMPEEHERKETATATTPPLEKAGEVALSRLARLVIEAYVAVNVAPLHGQKPETYGTSHVLRLFSGNIAKHQESAELNWLVERPELFHLTMRAFRFAVKISIDAAAMGEEIDIEYGAFADLAEDLQHRWFLGVEGSMPWEVAMKQRWPNLMALKAAGISEVQIVRLRYTEDACRVGELRRGVWNSIWASASLELRYFANDDDERYSIQAHPTLFRNMAVQCAEYPIFVSPATTVWLS